MRDSRFIEQQPYDAFMPPDGDVIRRIITTYWLARLEYDTLYIPEPIVMRTTFVRLILYVCGDNVERIGKKCEELVFRDTKTPLFSP